MNFFSQLADSDDPHSRDKKRNLFHVALGICAWFLLSSLVITLHALDAAYEGPDERWSNFLGVLSNSALIGAAFISVGGLLGFIFGIPRVLKLPPTPPATTPIIRRI